METNNGSIILSKFISKDIERIYKYYDKIDNDVAKMIGAFMNKLEREKIDFDPYENFTSTKALAEVLHEENNIEVVKLYTFLKAELKLMN